MIQILKRDGSKTPDLVKDLQFGLAQAIATIAMMDVAPPCIELSLSPLAVGRGSSFRKRTDLYVGAAAPRSVAGVGLSASVLVLFLALMQVSLGVAAIAAALGVAVAAQLFPVVSLQSSTHTRSRARRFAEPLIYRETWERRKLSRSHEKCWNDL